MKQDEHRLLERGMLGVISKTVSHQDRLAELERQLEQQGQQLAALLQMFLDLKGEPR